MNLATCSKVDCPFSLEKRIQEFYTPLGKDSLCLLLMGMTCKIMGDQFVYGLTHITLVLPSLLPQSSMVDVAA